MGDAVRALGQKYGFDVTSTKDGRIFDSGDFKKYAAVLFFTTGDLTTAGTDKKNWSSDFFLSFLGGGISLVDRRCQSLHPAKSQASYTGLGENSAEGIVRGAAEHGRDVGQGRSAPHQRLRRCRTIVCRVTSRQWTISVTRANAVLPFFFPDQLDRDGTPPCVGVCLRVVADRIEMRKIIAN